MARKPKPTNASARTSAAPSRAPSPHKSAKPAKTAKLKPATKDQPAPIANSAGTQPRLFGSHLSIAGGMCNAIHEAEKLGFSTVQVFTKNQQQWAAKPLDPAAIRDWRSEQARLGWNGRTVSHASYLINLASPDDVLWRKSIDLMRDEIERCEQLGIAYLVHHPGAFTSSSLDAGLARIALAYKELFSATPGYQTVSCLENTAGAGSTIGRTFDELARLRTMIADQTGRPERIGFCIDTCHAHAAGYDLSPRANAEQAIDALDTVCGLQHVRVLHLNDSKAPAGSRLDRHQHIGHGTIGDHGFAAVINRQALRNVPMILETPKEDHTPGIPWDSVNKDRLLGLLSDD